MKPYIEPEAWAKWHREWALRLLIPPRDEFKDILAGYACRDATTEPVYGSVPAWFWRRFTRVACTLVPACKGSYYVCKWQDHIGKVKYVLPSGESVWCYVAEPYEGEFSLDSPRCIAKLTGCDLVVDRIAWWDPSCVRLLFVPRRIAGVWSHKLTVKAWKATLPKPSERLRRVVFGDIERELLCLTTGEQNDAS